METGMIFVFESENLNFISCPDVNPSGIRRFTPSPMIETLLRYKQTKQEFSNFNFDDVQRGSIASVGDSKYIIASGVAHAPYDWCGVDTNSYNWRNLFDCLNDRYLGDLQKGKAFLLLDQCHEGYHTDWLFPWFHENCVKFNINPKQIIYVTGNMDVENQYILWLKDNPQSDKMLVLGYPIFEAAVYTEGVNLTRVKKLPPLPTVIENIEYKQNNLSDIKLYNCLQKRPRAHRIWLFNKLFFNGLLDDGINSMNFMSHEHTYYFNKVMESSEYEMISALLPMLPPTNENHNKELEDFSSMDSGKYQMRFNDDLMLQTWVSVISEASFGEETCFLSEKIFKPLAAGHPFIAFGNKNSLHYLQKMGYKTFEPFIDERYDTLDTWDRLDAIISSLKKIKDMPVSKKLEWYKDMSETLIYNQKVIEKNSVEELPKAFIDLAKYIREQ